MPTGRNVYGVVVACGEDHFGHIKIKINDGHAGPGLPVALFLTEK